MEKGHFPLLCGLLWIPICNSIKRRIEVSEKRFIPTMAEWYQQLSGTWSGEESFIIVLDENSSYRIR